MATHTHCYSQTTPNKVINSVFKSQRGYSLLELIITCALLATLSAIATPSFAAIINKSKMATSAYTLHQSLVLARTSAMTRSKTVLVCQLANNHGPTCVKSHKRNQNWKNGWQVFVDNNKNNEYDAADEVLREFRPNNNTAVVFNQNGRLRFFPDGSARSAGFYVCTKNSTSVTHIKLLHSGRARTRKNTQKNILKRCIDSLN